VLRQADGAPRSRTDDVVGQLQALRDAHAALEQHFVLNEAQSKAR
jgi:hypothetical protein